MAVAAAGRNRRKDGIRHALTASLRHENLPRTLARSGSGVEAVARRRPRNPRAAPHPVLSRTALVLGREHLFLCWADDTLVLMVPVAIIFLLAPIPRMLFGH